MNDRSEKYPRVIDPPETWYMIDVTFVKIQELDGVVRATATRVIRRTMTRVDPPLVPRLITCSYSRSEVFPTYREAVEGLVARCRVVREWASSGLDVAREKFEEAGDRAGKAEDILRGLPDDGRVRPEA